jgi:glutamate-1-semialdehyde aminotransferase/acyl carrier protein
MKGKRNNSTNRATLQNGQDKVMQTEYERITSASPVHVEQDTPRRERIMAQLRALLGVLLHCEPTDIAGQTSFLEMGADSLVLLDAVKQIEQTFALKLPIRLLFSELSTLDALSTHLDKALPADIYPAKALPAAVVLPAHEQQAQATPSRVEYAPPANGRATIFSKPQQPLSTPAAINLERVFTQQLDILHRQLELLRAYTAKPPSEQSAGLSPLLGNEKMSPASGNADQGVPADVSSPLAQAPYVPYQPIRPKGTETLNMLQQRHLEDLRARLTRRTRLSREYAQRYRPTLADNRASAGFRFSIKEMLYPIVANKSQGAYFWDLDGNRYLDVTMGFGVNLFGHRAPFIQEALTRQLETGIQLGPQSDLAGEVATLIHELTGMERVTFCNSGTEAVMTAVRLARTATGKSKIVLFSGSYHGTFDGILARPLPQNEHAAQPLAPGIPEKMIDDVLVLPYGNEHTLDIIQAHAHELAAVLVEPVQSRHPDVQPREFLQQLRALTNNAGVALIFDETITGFRIHPGGAQAWFGVQADLATYGKIVGGGMPIGIVAGKAHYLDGIDGGMWHYGDLSYPQAETTFFAGTFCKHPLAMSGAYAVLSYLKSQGPALQEQLNAKTAHLVATVNAFFQDEQVPIVCIHFGSLFRFSFTQNMDLFFYHLLEKGIYIWEGRNCFLSTAHTDEDIALLIQAIKEAIWELRDGGFLPTSPSGGSAKASSEHEAAGLQDASGNSSSATAFPPEVRALREREASSGKVERSFPLTAAQHNFWAASQVDTRGGFNSYIETAVLQLDGEFSLPAMQNAFRIIVDRHEALRTVISAQGDLQYVLPEMPVDVSYLDLSDVSTDARPQLVSHWLEAQRYQGLDLTQGPLVSLSILKLEPQQHLLLFAGHHIIVDGWSITLALQEIAHVYTAQVQQRPYQLKPPLQLREYVYWQEQQERQGMLLADERFWTARLSEPFPALALPLDHPRTPYKTFAGARVHLGLEADLQQALRQLASRHNCTLYMVLLATYLLWLHHVSGQHDVVVGVPTAGRICPGSETLVGHAMNLFPLRSTLVGSPTFLAYLHLVKQHLLAL